MQPSWVIDPRPFDRAGELLLAAVTAVLAEKERVRLAIPGGSALEAVCMARQRLKEQWRRVVLTWVDERCVGVEDEASNRGEAARRGLVAFGNGREVGVAPALVVPLFEDGESPAGAVRRVRSVWKSELAEALDIALLGMGPDGHIASLFPSSRSLPNEDWVAHVADSPKPPADRITLTRAALATARHLILVAAGEEKRQALDRLMAGDPALPACGLEGLVVVTDVALAKRT
jgi:6-phosphogluconolactonase